MEHILAKIRGTNLAEVENTLKRNFLKHAAEGIFLEHLWKNQERNDEIFFLFRTLHAGNTRQWMQTSLVGNGNGFPQPEITFLEGK